MDQNEKPSKETLKNWHKDPNNWIWGIFYFNREDKRIFPPKRMAWTGWTINFANPMSVSVLLIILLIVVIISSFNEYL